MNNNNDNPVLRQPLAPSRGKMPEGQKGVGSLRIVFMGTPEFAVGTLSALVEGGYNVVAVVTQPDKPVGRHGSVLQPSQVKQYALEHNIPVLQPVKMKDPEFIEQLIREISDFIRMQTHSAVNKVIPIYQAADFRQALFRRPDIQHKTDIVLLQRTDDLLAIRVKSFIIIMYMCIYYHMLSL